MSPVVGQKIEKLAGLCQKRRVSRLALFGSAAGDTFDPSRSDLDVLVEFESMPPPEHADAYFGLSEDLERLFGVRIDLVEPRAIRNPYFREAVERTQVVLYEAA